MKGIKCCGDCGYYNWKKHKCTRAVNEGEAQDHFYADCPLPDVITLVHGHIKIVATPMDGEDCVCSVCGHTTLHPLYKFCPYCGVKFDEVIYDDAE